MVPKAKGFTCRGDLDCPSGGSGVSSKSSRQAKINSWYNKYKKGVKGYSTGKKVLKIDAALDQISEALSLLKNYNDIMEIIPLMNRQELQAFEHSTKAFSTLRIGTMRNMVQIIYTSKNRTRIQAQAGALLLKGTVAIGGVFLSIPFKSVGYVSLALEVANFDYSYINKK